MNAWRKLILLKKSVSWIVLTAVVMLSLFPAHMHLHHDDDGLASSHVSAMAPESHDHTSTIHAVSDTTGHSGHDDVTVLPATSDTLIKKVNVNPIIFAILIGIFVFLTITSASQRFRQQILSIPPRKIYICLSPPLRAPPLH
jgi:hypothetical protein